MEKKKCPVGVEVADHIKRGFTPSGSQKYKCKKCGSVYAKSEKVGLQRGRKKSSCEILL